MINAPVLAFPELSKHFQLETDASNTCIGAVISQDGRLIAFYRKKLSVKMSFDSIYSKELYAITKSICKWRRYLLGMSNDSSKKTPERQHYLSKLLGFEYTTKYMVNLIGLQMPNQEETVLMDLLNPKY